MAEEKYEYGRQTDGCLIRREESFRVWLYMPKTKSWKRYPILSKDIRDSSTAAWHESSRLTEAEAMKHMKELDKAYG